MKKKIASKRTYTLNQEKTAEILRVYNEEAGLGKVYPKGAYWG